MARVEKIKLQNSKPDVFIPVLVDDVKQDERFLMTRCTCFVVEATEGAVEPWNLGLHGPDFPVLMMGFAGVIVSPGSNREIFESPEDLDLLFNRIEDGTPLVVETTNLWLPNDLPVRGGQAVRDLNRGQVLRVGRALFQVGHRFAMEMMDAEKFVGLSHGFTDQIYLSESETAVFGAWGQRQVDEAKQVYISQRRRGQVLSWRDASGDLQAG